MYQQATQLSEDTVPELLSADYALFPIIRWFNFLGIALLSFGLMQGTDVSWTRFLIALGFWGVGLLFILLTLKSVVEMTHNTITWVTFRGCFQIHWDEIKHVAFTPSVGRMGIRDHCAGTNYRGSDKSFHTPGPDGWRGEDRWKMWSLLENQLRSRDIHPKYTWGTARPSPNTRLSWREYFDQIPALSEERRALARSVLIPAWVSLSIAGLSTLGLVIWGFARVFSG